MRNNINPKPQHKNSRKNELNFEETLVNIHASVYQRYTEEHATKEKD